MTVKSYSASTVYNAGDEVMIGGTTYQANWWVTGQDPSLSNGAIGTGQPWTVMTGSTGTIVPPSTQPPSTSGTTAGTNAASTAAAYSTSSIYNAGDLVSLNGITYKANWWITAHDPSLNNGAVGTGQPWSVVSTASSTGSTSSGTTNSGSTSLTTSPPATGGATTGTGTATSTTTPSTAPLIYSASAAYTGGQFVTENGVTYQANWWVSGQDPAKNSGVAGSGSAWTLIGPTATTPPSAPTQLTAARIGANSVSLSWDNGGAAGSSYEVFENGKQIATVNGTYDTVNGLAAGTAYTFSVEALNQYGASQQSAPLTVTTATASTATNTGPVFSPYVDMSLTPDENIVQMAKQAGLQNVTLAFVQSNGNGSIGWGGVGSISDATFANGTTILSAVQGLQNEGVSVAVSFGGAAGIDPAAAATSAAALQAQYQSVINTYGVHSLDFDIEGAVVANSAATNLRNQALVGLEAANPGLEITFTLPVLPTGLTSEGLNLLSSAESAGVSISRVNIMAMDYGSAVDNGGQMGLDAINAAQATEAQLVKLGLTTTTIGVVPMIGVNDTSSEVFTLADAQQLASYAATDAKITALSMWSLARDNGSGAGSTWASPTSSSIVQTPYQFSSILGAGH